MATNWRGCDGRYCSALMLISLLAVPLALTLRKSKLGAVAPAGH